MNGIVSFRECTLSDQDLTKKLDEQTDNMFRSQKIPSRHVPALTNDDYDLLVGELILRFHEQENKIERYVYQHILNVIHDENPLTELEEYIESKLKNLRDNENSK